MILPDLNLLLYAYNSHVPQHEVAREWWETTLNGSELVGMPYEVVYGFIRIATNRRLGAAAVPLAVARSVVEEWLSLPQVRMLTPGARHFARVMDLMTAAMASGSLLSDAVLAAYAIESRACLFTNDTDFARFPGLNWKNPLLPT
jgi:toxin-antitoxin system PIN domain toxin